MATLKQGQYGFSLIEIMVTLVLSLLLLAGLYSALIGDQKSYKNAFANQSLVAKNRMSVQSLKLYLQQAGFKEYQQLLNNTQLPAVSSDSIGFAWSNSQLLQAQNNVSEETNTKPGTDSLAIRFFGGDTENSALLLCDGSSLAEGEWASLAFYISTDNSLICRDLKGEMVFAQGIENMQLQFGFRQAEPNHYLRADQIQNWEQVNRIKIALLVSEELSSSPIKNHNSYQVLDETVPAANDSRLRQVVTKTIVLPNVGV